MLAPTHLAIGALFLQWSAGLLQPQSTILFYTGGMIAALLPDVDHHGSTIHKACFLTRIIPWLFKHRGFFHTIWPALIIAAITWHWSTPLTLGILVGWTSHLLGDSMTQAGVNWLMPGRLIIKGPIKTGGMMETIIFLITVVANVYLGVR